MMQQLEQLNFTGQEDAFGAPLVCVARREETDQAATFVFEAGNQALFRYFPGQFITLQLEIDGKAYARSYSMSSSPSRPFTLECTVKRVDGGLVSNWLLDNLQVGAEVQALPPAGEFSLKGSDKPARYLLMSAGSGITPVMSMARWLLDTCQPAQIDFIHSSPDADRTIFQNRLQLLDQTYSDFNLHQLFSKPASKAAAQRFDAEWFNRAIPDLTDTEVYVCGPARYMETVEVVLQARGFDMTRFFKESFLPEVVADKGGEAASSVGTYQLDVEGHPAITIKAGQSILDAVEAAGITMTSACRSGVCGACRCQVTDGHVESSSTVSLTPDDIADGFVLACSATVNSDCAVKTGR